MVTIDLLPPSNADEAIAATSRAFWPDPLFGFFAKNPIQEHRTMPIFLGALLRDAYSHGEVWSAIDDGRVRGAACWLPPGATPRSKRRERSLYFACAKALLTGRNRRIGIRLFDAVEKRHPKEAHWYLALLGVDPIAQGSGLGRKLLTPVLNRCDETIEPAYLETQKPENLPFYERFGFRVLDEVSVPGSPPVWLMWRDPDPTRIDNEDKSNR